MEDKMKEPVPVYYKKMFDHSLIAFCILKVEKEEKSDMRNFSFVYANQAFANLYEKPIEYIVGNTFFSIFPQAEGNRIKSYYKAAYQGETTEFRSVVMEIDKYVNILTHPIEEGYCGVLVQDFSDWMQSMRRTLAETEGNLLLYDQREKRIYIPQKYCSIEGLAGNYGSIYELFHQLVSKEKLRDLLALFDRDTENVATEVFELLDGRSLRITVPRDEGDRDEIVIGYMEDITRQINSQRDLDLGKNIIESLSQDYHIILLIDPNTRKTKPYRLEPDTSKQFIAFLDNYPYYDSFVELYLENCVIPEDRQRVRESGKLDHILQVLQEKPIYNFNFRRMEDGVITNLQGSYVMMKNAQEMPLVILAVRNIDELVKQENIQRQLLENALEQARQASVAKSAFLSNMSHDIRTPMNAIMGYTVIGATHIDEQERVKDCFEKIANSSSHLLQLINDVLDMSRIESGRAYMKEKPGCLGEATREAMKMLYTEAKKKNIALTYDVSGLKRDHVLMDEVRVKQVLTNLVSNSIKYTPSGGNVKVSTWHKESENERYGRFVLEVMDDGVGISPEFMPHVFEPFERQNESIINQVEGTGLGLAITKNLVESMGGEIAIESTPNQGTKVVVNVTLKYYEKNVSEDKRNTYLQAQQEHNSKRGKYRILVVEDNLDNQNIARDLLQEYGYQSCIVGSGEEALEILEREEPGVHSVLLDLRLPGIDGYEVSKRIREHAIQHLRKLPIVALTADAFEENRKKAMESGMDAFITKPTQATVVIDKLDELLLGN